MSYQKSATKWNINKQTLFNHVKHPNRSFTTSCLKTLSVEEEKGLADWARTCADKGVPRTRNQLLTAANTIQKNRLPEATGKPTTKWLEGFLKRNDLKPRKAQSWSKAVDDSLKESGDVGILFDDTRVYNCDESFSKFNPARGYVIVPRATKKICDANKDE